MIKKKCLFIGLLMFAGSIMAQQMQEVVYLHNGSIIKGVIIEQVPNVSIKIKTADGSIFAYPMSEVEKISKEEVRKSNTKGGHRGLDFNIDMGYNIATKGGGGSLSAEIGLGKRFNKHFYWGIGTGAYIPTKGGDTQIPLTTDFKVYFPLRSSSIAPNGTFRIGYIFNTADDFTTGKGKNQTTYEMPDYIMLQIMPGMQIPLSKKVDFNFALGYTHTIPTKGGIDGSGAFTFKAGFGFHKSLLRTKPRKPKKPIRDKGLQFTFEGGALGFIDNEGEDGYNYDYLHNGSVTALTCTYKFNPHISLGLGFGADVIVMEQADALKRVTITENGDVEKSRNDLITTNVAYKAFVRGQYRLTNKRFSPFVACDAGMRFYSYVDGLYEGEPEEIEETTTGVFAAPALGLSLRTTNNSYLELKAGYTFAPELPGKKGESISGNITHISSCKPYKMSAPFITLGFTHTFKAGSK